MSVENNWQQVKRNIAEACARSGRDPEDVQVIAVTKYVSLETTKKALDIGIAHIGESRAQDAALKWERLGDRGTWHFIGHLQSNKVKDVIDKFAYIHSLDRLSLAKEIQKRASRLNLRARCFVQVNVSGEKSKSGLSPDDLVPFLKTVASMDAVEIVGLMTMAPLVDDPEETRPVFRELKQLRDHVETLNIPGVRDLHLSMGMSNDYTVAVEEGATFVRLGSTLVGRETGE